MASVLKHEFEARLDRTSRSFVTVVRIGHECPKLFQVSSQPASDFSQPVPTRSTSLRGSFLYLLSCLLRKATDTSRPLAKFLQDACQLTVSCVKILDVIDKASVVGRVLLPCPVGWPR